jgi:hypothetical protein
MPDDELVEAYTQGRISRRTFVRRLVAGGLPVSVAMTYASTLVPGSARWLPPALRTLPAFAVAGSHSP